MSTTYSAALISILAMVLPMLGISVGSSDLTTTVQTILVVVSALWVMFKRVQRGDISLLGVRK